MEIHKMDISIPYYEDVTRISNSNIGWFLNKGPSFLHKMLSGEGEELNLPQLKIKAMKLKHIILSASVLTVGILSINAIKKGEPKDSLDKKKFTVTMTEIKEGAAPKKGVEDELEFKAGKGMFSMFLFDKLQYVAL